MPIIKEQVHGYWVLFEEELRNAIDFLKNDLQQEEAKTIFSAAKLNGFAEFEDHMDRNWTMVYNKQDFNYTLVKRNRE
jgi:hypothetical protein